jgi:transposase-like protein/GNAT superfamily N-acetyltransferase
MEHQTLQHIIELYKQKLPVRKIAQETGYHHKTISKHLKKLGYTIVNKGNTKTKTITPIQYKEHEQEHLIISLYIKDRIGSPTIAKKLGISKAKVLKILKTNNIKRNNSYKKSRPLKKEVKQLYKKGASIETIANQFNVPDYVISKILGKTRRTPGQTMSSVRGFENKITKLYQDGLSSYDIADILGFNNAEAIIKLLKKTAITRSKEEVRKLTAIKLSNPSYQSKPEKIVEQLLLDLEFKIERQFPLNGWNFDFKINNTLIEIQSYWHRLPNRIQKDKVKAKIAKQHNYNLFYIWESQLKNLDLVKELLLYQLNPKTPVCFSFSNIEIKENRQDAKQLMKWHYHQKIGQFKHEYVAYLDHKPIAACVFSSIIRKQIAKKQSVNHTEILELSRFVIHPDYHKRNFSSWLLSRCIKRLKKEEPQIKKLIAFSDTTYNHQGYIYRATNWHHDGIIPSDYWYVTPTRSIKHKKTVWNAAKKDNLTESEFSARHKLQKVYGMPKHRFIKTLN